jgi:hypothetical protein
MASSNYPNKFGEAAISSRLRFGQLSETAIRSRLGSR